MEDLTYKMCENSEDKAYENQKYKACEDLMEVKVNVTNGCEEYGNTSVKLCILTSKGLLEIKVKVLCLFKSVFF